MKTLLTVTIALFGFLSNNYSQDNPTWSKWNWLLGEWVGEGGVQPGQGAGTFTFAYDLDKKVIIRKSHSEYPDSQGRPAVVHNDLMIVYGDFNGNPAKAIYFDNEGHTINYTLSYSIDSIVFLSDRVTDIPVFRLTYSLLPENIVNTKFEWSQDGQNFKVYIEGKSKKK